MSVFQRFLQDVAAGIGVDSQDNSKEYEDVECSQIYLYFVIYRNLNIVMETFDWRTPEGHFQRGKKGFHCFRTGEAHKNWKRLVLLRWLSLCDSRKIHCLTSESHVWFHAKNRYRTKLVRCRFFAWNLTWNSLVRYCNFSIILQRCALSCYHALKTSVLNISVVHYNN